MTERNSNTTAPTIGREAIRLLAALYRLDDLKVACLCDEHLDRSGALLGRVRDCVRTGATNDDQ